MTHQLEEQTKNAFDFIQKLYFEISYLIKEVEGLLQREDERFVIGRPSGYGITAIKSTGLDPSNVDLWLYKSLTVFFCPESETELVKGQTVTQLHDKLKLLILDIDLTGKKNSHPRIIAGCIHDIVDIRKNMSKFENGMSEFAYYHDKIFSTLPKVDYKDSYISFKGTTFEVPLFSVNKSDDIIKKIIEPMLNLYRSV